MISRERRLSKLKVSRSTCRQHWNAAFANHPWDEIVLYSLPLSLCTPVNNSSKFTTLGLSGILSLSVSTALCGVNQCFSHHSIKSHITLSNFASVYIHKLLLTMDLYILIFRFYSGNVS